LIETEADVREHLRQHGGVLARVEGEAVGGLRFESREGHLYVSRVSVDPFHQGHGIGRALMEWIQAWARDQGYSEVRVGVRSQLPRNQAFYQRLGYRVLRAHARPGSSDVIWYEMSLVLV
jgi:tRNA threonylcarbamoyladenosine biosynthesis protein TsaE